MAELSSCVESLLENDPELVEGALDVLMKISDNILKDPKNEKFRAVNLSSNAVENKLLPAIGALEVLFLMGFEEAGDKLILPSNDPLDNLRIYREQLTHLKAHHMKKTKSGAQQTTAAAAAAAATTAAAALMTADIMTSEAEMKSELMNHFDRVLVYESPSLQDKARQLIPVQKLHEQARSKLATINKDIDEKAKPLDFQDCVLIELLDWFKRDFFTWFNCPSCPLCSKTMVGVRGAPPTEEDLVWGGSRVEGYSCTSCKTSERFVRYNHPGKLLETRRGRCGEWANCFTLMCRAMGMDARYVLDYTDHVWSEVYSQSQGRWLHTDCCENVLDTPLMYEHGWGKKLTYILAFSKDETVDVTWRYTTNLTQVLSRRNKCRENWLISTLIQLSKKRQETFAASRKNFLEMRLVAETAEFLGQKTVKESEKQGRSSGSLAWRLSRGETKENTDAGYTFVLNSSEEERKEFILKYSPAQDQYVRLNAEEGMSKGWQNGVHEANNVFRKHESDWKMVYLCRTEGSSEGKVSWVFDWSHTNLQAKSALVVFQHVTFEDGCIEWQLCTGDTCVKGPKEGVLELTKIECGDKKLELTAFLTKGQGNVAWQHTQLFRQPDSSTEYPFYVRLRFK